MTGSRRIFADRAEAGRRLGAVLAGRDDLGEAVVLGLPRGGVVVAREVATVLGAPLDLVAVRKLGAPGDEEYAVGAIAEGGERVVDDAALRLLGVTPEALAAIEAREAGELVRRAEAYRRGRAPRRLRGRTALLVDDGVATGSTAIAAARSVRARGAARVVLAVPVAPPEARAGLAGEVDELVALSEPAGFAAVGAFYRDFRATGDAEVVAALEGA